MIRIQKRNTEIEWVCISRQELESDDGGPNITGFSYVDAPPEEVANARFTKMRVEFDEKIADLKASMELKLQEEREKHKAEASFLIFILSF